MTKKVEKDLSQIDKDIEKKIAEACKQVILQEEIIKLKEETQKELAQARQQLIFWDTRVKQLSGSLATCNSILQKSQRTKALELEGDNTNQGKNESSRPD